MKDYLIEQIVPGRASERAGTDEGMHTAELRLRNEEETCYLSVSLSKQFALFFKTDCSAVELLAADDGDPDIADWFERHLLCEIGDFEAYFRNPDREWHGAFLVLLYLVCAEPGQISAFAADTEGKHLSEVTVPAFGLPQDCIRR